MVGISEGLSNIDGIDITPAFEKTQSDFVYMESTQQVRFGYHPSCGGWRWNQR